MFKHHDKQNSTLGNGGTKNRQSSRLRRVFKNTALWAIFVSALLHIALIIVLPMLLNKDPSRTRAEALRVWLTEKPAIKKSNEKKEEPRTVVQLLPLPNTLRPKEARYHAEQDQSTTKETSASLYEKSLESVSDSREARAKNSDKKTTDTGKKLARKKNDPLGLRPTFKENTSPSSSTGGEYLAELEPGEHTELNAWQWRHAPFFNRIKERIGQIWSPQTQIARYDPEGILLGAKDRVTVLQVTLDREGVLRDLKITDQSGVAYLDDEAMRTFRAAAPFLYPPKELFQNKDEFSFTFAFRLYINRGFSFGFDWNND